MSLILFLVSRGSMSMSILRKAHVALSNLGVKGHVIELERCSKHTI